MKVAFEVFAVACLSLGVGCSSNAPAPTADLDGGPPDGALDGAPADAPPDVGSAHPYPIGARAVTWEPCSLDEGADDGLAECATLELPLLWDDPDDGRTLGIRAKRLRAPAGSEAQLWLLAGGPGQSGTWALAGFAERIQALYPGLDLYTLDHRGTGYSGRLGCPEAESESSPGGSSIRADETPACIEYLRAEWGDGLGGITTTASAVDVAAYIESSREEGKKVFLHGGSYGTYWLQRYLQIFPRQADGAIMAGIFPADGTVIWYDEMTNAVARDFMELCGDDAFCSSKLGSDPWARLGALLEDMAQGHCVEGGITRSLVRTAMAYLMYWDTTNIVVPAATYRLERCAPEDRAAIQHMFRYLFGAGGLWELGSYSMLLQHHIQFSEMWDHDRFEGVDLDRYFTQISDAGYVVKNAGRTKRVLHDLWPTYSDARWDDGWADTEIPMLMLQGRYDPATPVAEAVRVGKHYAGANQHYVEFPFAAHRTLGATPRADGTDCALSIFVAFLKDPKGALDTNCAATLPPPDFAGSQALAESVFGTEDLWDNTIP